MALHNVESLGAWTSQKVVERRDQPAVTAPMSFGSSAFSDVLLLGSGSPRRAPVPSANVDLDIRAMFSLGEPTTSTEDQDSARRSAFRFEPSGSGREISFLGQVVWSPTVDPESLWTANTIQGSYRAFTIARSHKTITVGPRHVDVTQVTSAPAAPRSVDQGQGVAERPPIISVIWGLVEKQQTAAARVLVDQLPNDPQFRKVRGLLRRPTTSRAARKDTGRTGEYDWLRQYGAQHRGYWVAISGNVLVGEAASLVELRQQLRNVPVVPPPLVLFIE